MDWSRALSKDFIELCKSAKKKLISTLIYFISFLTSSQLDRPEINAIALPSLLRQVTPLLVLFSAGCCIGLARGGRLRPRPGPPLLNAVFFLAGKAVNLFNFVTKLDDYVQIECSSLWQLILHVVEYQRSWGRTTHEAETKAGGMQRAAGGGGSGGGVRVTGHQ